MTLARQVCGEEYELPPASPEEVEAVAECELDEAASSEEEAPTVAASSSDKEP